MPGARPGNLSFEQKARLDKLAKRILHAKPLEESFAAFFKAAWHVLEPNTDLVWNWHMDVVCEYLQALYEGRLRVPRLIVNIPPGTSKSLMVSVVWPAWIWAKDPTRRFLTASNDDTLVTRDNVKMRSLIQSEWYQNLWSHKYEPDKSQWDKRFFQNTKLGFRQGVTIKGSVTGKRGDIQIIDDPHDARRAFSDTEIQTAVDGWDQGMSTRVNDMEHSIRVVIMQRLRTNDLTGHLASKEQDWVRLTIPMEYIGEPSYDPINDIGPEAAKLADPRKKSGEPLDPVRFNGATLRSLREDLGEYGWAGQMQQDPVPLGGGIIKKKWWVRWEGLHDWEERNKGRMRRPAPIMKHVFWSWDTAFTTKDRSENAFSAGTKWGLFWDEGEERDKLMLLNAWHGRVAFSDLRTRIFNASKTDTDCHLIERKGSGISITQELRRNRRIKVRTYDPRGDGDKEARAMLCTSHFERGMIVYPDRPWAVQVIDWISSFPSGAPPSADYTDTCSQAILYVVRRQWIRHPDDVIPDDPEDDFEDEDFAPLRRHGTYG